MSTYTDVRLFTNEGQIIIISKNENSDGIILYIQEKDSRTPTIRVNLKLDESDELSNLLLYTSLTIKHKKNGY